MLVSRTIGAEVDFQSLRRGLASEVPAQVLVHQFGVFGTHQFGQPAADELGRVRDAAEFGKAGIGEFDAVAFDEHCFVHGSEQAPVNAFALVARRALLLQPLDQAIDAFGNIGGAACSCVRRESLGEVAALGHGLHAFAEFAQPADFTRALHQGNRQRYRHGTQQDQRKRQDGHAPDWPCPLGLRFPTAHRGLVIVVALRPQGAAHEAYRIGSRAPPGFTIMPG